MANDNISPDILNFLNKIVQNRIEDYTISFEGNSEKGGNFLGDILFINLKNKTNDEVIHLVVKQAYPSLQENPMFKGVYQNEINFYQKIWKTFDDFQKAHNVGFNKIPKYLGSDPTDGTEKIALDNLKYHGFVMHDKNEPLTKEHVELIMKSYGTFHGISFAYRELYPEEFAELVEPCKNVSFADMNPYFKYEFTDLVKILENEIDDNIIKIMKNYVDEAGKMFVDCLNYVGDTPLLVQGDCWSNNMMFKSDEDGTIEDMRFLDFQYTKSGSPVYDLAYSIYSGVSKDILDNLDFYLKIYHDNFSSTMKKLGRDAQESYPFEKLKEDWKQYNKFGFLMSLPIWKLKYADKNFIPDLKEDSNPAPDQNGSANELNVIAKDKVQLYKQRIIDLMTHMYSNGFL